METLPVTPVAHKPRHRTSSVIYNAMDEAAWPAMVPPLSKAEAIKATRMLYRRFYRKTPVTIIPSPGGRRHTWLGRGNKMVVVWSSGWHGLVHDLSHYFHRRLRPRDPDHGDNHRALEREMIEHVVNSGWLDGKLVPKPRVPRPPKAVAPRPDPLIVDHEKAVARVKAWKTRLRRAKTGLATAQKAEIKLRRKRQRTIRFTLN